MLISGKMRVSARST